MGRTRFADGDRSLKEAPASVAGPIAVLGLFLALALPLLFVPSLAGEFWTPRYALLPLEALVGLCLVLTLLRTSLRAPAALGIGFATWAVLSTALSPDPLMAVWGEWLWGTGLVFALALVGMWGIGALAGSRGAQLIENGLVLAAVINAALTKLRLSKTATGLPELVSFL